MPLFHRHSCLALPEAFHACEFGLGYSIHVLNGDSLDHRRFGHLFQAAQGYDTVPEQLPSAEQRQQAASLLWDLYPAFPDDEPETALFLLEEAKRAYDGWVESNAKIEAKATSLTGFLAAGAGLLTVIGSLHGDKSGLENGPFLMLAFVSALVALFACLYILRVKLRPHPTINEYISPAVALSSKARFHLALMLSEAYNQYALQISRLRRFDRVAWTVAQLSLAVAVGSILVHFFISLQGGIHVRSVVNCHGQSGPFRTGGRLEDILQGDLAVADKPVPSYNPPPLPPSSGQMHEGWTPKNPVPPARPVPASPPPK